MRGLIPIHLLRLIVSPRDHGCDSHCSRFGTLGENWEHSQKARYASPAQKQEGCPERKPAKLSFSNRLSVCLQMFGVTREDASLSRDSPKPPKMKLWHARQLGVTSCQEVWSRLSTRYFRRHVMRDGPDREAQKPISPA